MEEGPFYITFTYTFNHDESEVAYFAFTYPFSFEEIQKQSREIVEKFRESETIYAHKEVLGQSLEGRPMEMLTISSKSRMTFDREELIPGLFPENPANKSGGSQKRPFRFDKQTVFLTCRVHPGETPAQFVLNGIYDFLLNESNP